MFTLLLALYFQIAPTDGPLQCRITSEITTTNTIQLRSEVFHKDKTPVGKLGVSWTLWEAPAIVYFTPDARAMDPVVTVTKAGKYIFWLVANDGEHLAGCMQRIDIGKKAEE